MAQFSPRYEIQDVLGSGNFSSVHTALDKITGKTMAVKIMKTHQNIAIKEAALLKSFDHPNIVKLFDFEQDPFTGQARMVLEHMPENTLQLYQKQQFGLSEEQVKCILFQCALGLTYIHDRGIIHRDIKPENILINKHSAEIKIIDFGLAISEHKTQTDYVATRWYRAPQNLLGTKEYTTKIDVFAMACVAVQLYLGAPLFPGADNIDQLYKIFNILGEPNEESWPAGAKKFKELGFRIGDSRIESVLGLNKILKTASLNFISLMQKMLILNPSARMSSREIIQHPFFNDVRSIVPPSIYKRYLQEYTKDFKEGKEGKEGIERKEKDSGKRKEIIESAQNFINANRKKSLKKEFSEEKKQKKVQNLGKSYDLKYSQSIGNLNMTLKDNNREKIRQNPAKNTKNFPSQTSGLTFRGFNPVKAPKISIKQVKMMKQSNHDNVDSREASLKNSTNIDKSRNTINYLMEPRQIKRRVTDIREYRTPDVKNRSIDYGMSLNQGIHQSRFPVESLKLNRSPGLERSLAFNPADALKSHRFTVNQDASSRIVRNLSEVNPHSRRMAEFRPNNMQNLSNFPKERPSPIGINLLQSPKKTSSNEVQAPDLKRSIYTTPFHGKFQKLKLKPLPIPTFKTQNQDSKDRSDSRNSSFIMNQSKSQLTETQELQRSGNNNCLVVRQSVPTNALSSMNQPYSPGNPQLSFPRKTFLDHLHPSRFVPNDSKFKLPKSLEPSQIRDPRQYGKLVSPLGIRRETMQTHEMRPPILVTENKEYRQPRITTKKNVQNERVVQNLSSFLNGRREDRNISINVNLSFVEEKERGTDITRRGRI